MKYLKYILFGFLFLFIFNIDALAYGVECYYNLYDATNSQVLVGTVTISYDGENDRQPSITSDNKFNGLNIYVFVPTSISINNIQDSNDKSLVCPTLYWKYYTNSAGVYYNIYFDRASSMAGTFEKYGELQPTSDSWVENSGGSSVTNEYDSLNCAYKNTESTYQTFSFSILKPKNGGAIEFSNITEDGVSEYTNPSFEFRNFTYECPPYINISPRTWLNKRDFYVDPSETETNWVYTGETNYADQNAGYGIYLAYNASAKIKRVIIIEENNVYKINANGSNFDITNLADYKSTIDESDYDNYPTYLVQDGNGWHFTDTKPGSSYLNLYIYYEHLFEAKIDDDLTNTCQIIIGNDFLEFLNNNVLKIIYIGIPIILILLTSFDFAKVVFIDDKEGIKTAGKKFGKRVIVAVLIYLIPTILIFISNLIGADNIDECVKQLNQIVDEES